jgi:nicotinamide-nucleotide adenylyltransferase
MKQYKKGLILGRFQMLHKGHEYIIDRALELCDSVLVLIGSSDKSNTIDNPFDYELRKFMLEEVYKDKIKIAPLPDLGVGNVPAWGDYVLENALKLDGYPDCIIFGIEAKCDTWFNDNVKEKINFIKVDRQDIKINASTLRQYMYDNEYDKWKEFVNPVLYKYYSMLRINLMKAYISPSKPKITIIDDD